MKRWIPILVVIAMFLSLAGMGAYAEDYAYGKDVLITGKATGLGEADAWINDSTIDVKLDTGWENGMAFDAAIVLRGGEPIHAIVFADDEGIYFAFPEASRSMSPSRRSVSRRYASPRARFSSVSVMYGFGFPSGTPKNPSPCVILRPASRAFNRRSLMPFQLGASIMRAVAAMRTSPFIFFGLPIASASARLPPIDQPTTTALPASSSTLSATPSICSRYETMRASGPFAQSQSSHARSLAAHPLSIMVFILKESAFTDDLTRIIANILPPRNDEPGYSAKCQIVDRFQSSGSSSISAGRFLPQSLRV